MRKKKEFVKAVDKKYHTNFFEQFNTIIAEEKEEYAKEAQESTKTVITKSIPSNDNDYEEDVEVPDPEEIKENVLPKRGNKESSLNIDTTVFKGYELLSDDEKNQIVGIGDNQDLLFSEDSDPLEACDIPTCKFMFPVSFKYCPKCGQQYQ